MKRAFPLGRPLLAAALILGASAALSWLTPAHLDPDTRHRLLGVLLGAIVVVFANAIPKALVTRSALRCDPAADQAARRFAGWSLVFGGIGYMLASLLAPVETSSLAGGVLLGASLLAAVVRCVRLPGRPQA